MAIDYTWVNEHLIPIKQTAPILSLEMEKHVEFREWLDIDLKEAFHGLPISRTDQIRLAIATYLGTYTPA